MQYAWQKVSNVDKGNRLSLTHISLIRATCAQNTSLTSITDKGWCAQLQTLAIFKHLAMGAQPAEGTPGWAVGAEQHRG